MFEPDGKPQQPIADAGPRAALRPHVHMGHRRGMGDEAFDTAERFSEREAAHRPHEPPHCRHAARKLETHHGTEAALLSLAGALSGFVLGHAGAWVIRLVFPALPAWPPSWAVIAAVGTALVTGLLFGVMPARRAANLDPVQALMKR